ncbi:hypothetical protein [Lysinibacillus sp. NPDC093688]|uniref:hypothetical protein n=1 Tax=Lysinibacillus sp. NPDC093688 TaxID=3390577 RepID=UPI003CFF61C1
MEEKEIVQKSLEERFDEQNQKKQSKAPYTLFSVIGFIGAIVSVGMGFYKMFVYESEDDSYFSSESVNAYVGGDAYNYIINASYATGYFVLALVCMVFACTMLILNNINKHK